MVPTFQREPHQKRVLVSLNPRAGARAGRPLANQLVERLAASGWETVVSSDIDEVIRTAQRWSRDDELRAVVAGGGDGTVGLLTNELAEGVPLAILPLGTENLLAKHLGVRADAEAVAEVIDGGQGVRMDAGEADGRMFLLMLGCGFDADVVRRVHAARRGHIHHLSYAMPILESICHYQYPALRICCDGKTSQELSAKWAFVVNLPRYAGGLSLSPGADEFDGKLDVRTFRQGSLWHGLRYLTGVVLQQHEGWDDVEALKAETIRIESDGEAQYQLDGDPGGSLPVDIRVLPNRLTLLTPPAWIAAREENENGLEGEQGVG